MHIAPIVGISFHSLGLWSSSSLSQYLVSKSRCTTLTSDITDPKYCPQRWWNFRALSTLAVTKYLVGTGSCNLSRAMGKFWVFTFPNKFGGIFTWPRQAGNDVDSRSAFQLLLIRTFALALPQVWKIPHLQHLQQLLQATCGILTSRPGARTPITITRGANADNLITTCRLLLSRGLIPDINVKSPELVKRNPLTTEREGTDCLLHMNWLGLRNNQLKFNTSTKKNTKNYHFRSIYRVYPNLREKSWKFQDVTGWT